MPTRARFTALARSSPWRWRTLRFTASWTGPSATWPQPLRAWVRRPDGLRVETLEATLVRTDRQRRPGANRAVLTRGGGLRHPSPRPTPLDPSAPQPEFDADGLVARRPPDDGRIVYDDPMFQNYQWVAMLDPVELAEAARHRDQVAVEPVVIDEVRDISHHGRSAWEAVLRPRPFYEPRCSCCALLFNAGVLDSGPADARWFEQDFVFPDAHRVRLDVATGVCVLVEEIGGSRAGAGHDLAIEAVDEPMPDALFRAHLGD